MTDAYCLQEMRWMAQSARMQEIREGDIRCGGQERDGVGGVSYGEGVAV